MRVIWISWCWKTLLLLICMLGICELSYAITADAGEDRKLCENGGQTKLGGNPTAYGGEETYTYTWTTDTGEFVSNQANPMVAPTQTTTYKVVVKDANGITCFDFVTITVVRITVAIESTTVEGSITACMEDRDLTFIIWVEGLDIADDSIEYTVWHQKQPDASGGSPHIIKTRKENSTTVLFEVKANPDPDACMQELHHFFWNHVYTATDFITIEQGDFFCMSDPFSFDVHELSINGIADRFSGKQDKVVVGKEIDYMAFASDDCHSWTWRMPEDLNGFVVDPCDSVLTPAPYRVWNTTGGNARANTGLSSLDNGAPLLIPFSNFTYITATDTILRARNSWFGDTYGLVEAYCFDGDGDFYHAFHRVEVFFDPDLDLFGDMTKNNPQHNPSATPPIINTSTNTNEPCWFVFWKEGNVIDSIEHFVYVPNLQDYGLTVYIGGSPAPDTIKAHHLSMQIGPFTDEPKSSNYNLTWSAANINVTLNHNLNHIQSVANTIKHEMHHRHIHFYWRPQNLSEKYSGTWDTDYLPEEEEKNPGFYGYPGETYFVRSAPDTADTYNVKSFFPSSNYELYGDSELRCRILAQTSPAAIRFDDDWSMDQYNPKW